MDYEDACSALGGTDTYTQGLAMLCKSICDVLFNFERFAAVHGANVCAGHLIKSVGLFVFVTFSSTLRVSRLSTAQMYVRGLRYMQTFTPSQPWVCRVVCFRDVLFSFKCFAAVHGANVCARA